MTGQNKKELSEVFNKIKFKKMEVGKKFIDYFQRPSESNLLHLKGFFENTSLFYKTEKEFKVYAFVLSFFATCLPKEEFSKERKDFDIFNSRNFVDIFRDERKKYKKEKNEEKIDKKFERFFDCKNSEQAVTYFRHKFIYMLKQIDMNISFNACDLIDMLNSFDYKNQPTPKMREWNFKYYKN